MGVTSTGTSVNKVLNLSAAGTFALYGNGENVVSFECTFGDPFGLNHGTQVTLFRRGTDYYWIGTMISTYNQ